MLEVKNSETAMVIIGSLGKPLKTTRRKLGHVIGIEVIIDATIASGIPSVGKPSSISTIVGEKNNGVNVMASLVMALPPSQRRFRLGSKGFPEVRNCRIERTCTGRSAQIEMNCIFRAYFCSRVHSRVVGGL